MKWHTLIKGLVWEAIGVWFLAGYFWITTGSLAQALSIGVGYPAFRALLFYPYERLWKWLARRKTRKHPSQFVRQLHVPTLRVLSEKQHDGAYKTRTVLERCKMIDDLIAELEVGRRAEFRQFVSTGETNDEFERWFDSNADAQNVAVRITQLQADNLLDFLQQGMPEGCNLLDLLQQSMPEGDSK